MSKIHYVYEHWRPDLDEPFYVGKGSGGRANDMKQSRNRHHRHVQEKLTRFGMCVEVRLVSEGLSEDEALAAEIDRIAFWRATGIALVNMNEGGMGGRNPNDEVRAKLSKIHKGKKISDEQKAKTRATNERKKASPEYVAKQFVKFLLTVEAWADGAIPRPRPPKDTPPKIVAKRGTDEFRAVMRARWTPERRALQAEQTAQRAARMNAVRTAKGREPLSLEARTSISDKNRGRRFPPDFAANRRGVPLGEEIKQKMRASWTPERRELQAARAIDNVKKREANKLARLALGDK